MTYTGTHKTAQTMQRTAAGYRIQASRKNHYKRIRAGIRTAAGWITAIMLVLVLGKVGSLECDILSEKAFLSIFIYMSIAIVSFHVWELFGGNQSYYNNKYKGERKN